MKRAIPFSVLLGSFVLLSLQGYAQFTLTDNFEGSNVNNIVVLGGSPNPAMLTSGVSDPVNNGWLRITDATMNQKGFAYVKTSFPSDLGILLDFEYKAWRSTTDPLDGADGFSVYLFNADSTFTAGGYGGSLGYAPNTVAGITKGMAGGFLSVGIDEYGNNSNPTEGRNGGPGLSPNSIVLRGPTTNDPSTTNAYLAGFQVNSDPTANAIDYNTVTPTRPTDAQFYRRVQVEMTSSGGVYTVTVRWKKSVNGAFTQLITYTLSTPPPPNLKVGFAATTGMGINYHEVRNVIVTTPGNVRIDKRVDMTNAAINSQVTYTLSAFNYSPVALNGIILSDTLKDGIGNPILLSPSTFTINSVTFNNNGFAGNTAAGYPNGTAITTGFTNPLHITTNMAANSSSIFTIVGTIKGTPAGGVVSNAVGIDPTPTGITDSDPTNNNFTVNTNVLTPNVDLAVSETLANSCSDPSAGNTYTITVSNNGTNATTNGTQVMVTDNIPVGFSITSASGVGWTTTITGNLCTFTRSDVLASGFAYPSIGIQVLPTASTTSVSNQATVLYAGGETNTANNIATATLYPTLGSPAVSSPVVYCIGATASPLTATGTNLLWYNVPVGGAGSQTAPTPVTTTAGNTTYYVSQSNGTCESAFSSVLVTVNPNASLALSSAPATTSQVVGSNTAIQPITYTVGGSGTGATASGLPAGVGGTYNSGTFTIAGAPTTGGISNYKVMTTGGCSSSMLGGTITAIVSLPITLSNFTVVADQGRARLDWSTSMEINNTGFVIDRSADGQNWVDIGFQQSEAVDGNSSLPLYYTYYDKAPLSGNNYYRLKQTDLDGKVSYSMVVSISFGGNNGISISPNPASSSVNVTGVSQGQVIRLTDLNGGKLQEKIAAGEKETIQIGSLAPGIYILQIFGNGTMIGTFKLVKQ